MRQKKKLWLKIQIGYYDAIYGTGTGTVIIVIVTVTVKIKIVIVTITITITITITFTITIKIYGNRYIKMYIYIYDTVNANRILR